MERVLLRLAAAIALAATSSCGLEPAAPTDSGRQPEPAYRHRDQATEYAGDGREDAAPAGLVDVPIGWFGPDDPEHPLAGGMWSAALLAVEEANQQGGFDGKRYRLVPAWSENPWGTGVKEVTRLVYEDDVRALVGAPDGPSAHLVEQITARARLPFINSLSTDKSANLANVPWIYSCAPGDQIFAPLLAGALISAADGRSIAMVSCTDHDSRLLTRELLAALGAQDRGPDAHLEFRKETMSFDSQVDALRKAEPAVLALIAGPIESGRFLRALRDAGFEQPVIGGPRMGRRAFRESAGRLADGVVFPLLWDREAVGAEADLFAGRFFEQTGKEPDHAEALAYDSVRLLLIAIGKTGLNRVKIGDAVRALSPWSGVSGVVTWDRTGQNTRPVPLGTWRDGKRVRAGG